MTESPILTADQRAFLMEARRAVLVTLTLDGGPRPVPICFVLLDEAAGGLPALVTPLDDKPKRTDDPLSLARVRDVRRDPRVSVLVDRWDEDWTRLAWLRLGGRASILLPVPVAAADAVVRTDAIERLRRRYPQYRTHDLAARPLIRVDIERATGWSARTGSS